MKCEYCDNPVPNGAARCPSCGAAVSAQFPGTDVTPEAKMRSLGCKNKWVYILLGFFLGEFGIHNFYTGHIVRGIVKLLITILSFGFLCWISWIWAIVEICTVRIDSRGVPFVS